MSEISLEDRVADLRVDMATIQAEIESQKAESVRVLTRIDLMNARIDTVLSEFGKTNTTLAKLAGKLGGANLVIPGLTLLIGVLATLVAVHI